MGCVRFISDLHFGHKWMAKHRGFANEFDMNDYIIEQYNSVVNKKDLVFILGDITMETSKWYFYLDQLNGRKKVILGNHDMLKDIPELLKYVDGVAGSGTYKGIFLTHIPVHPNELDYRVNYNIHGHLHEKHITTFEPGYISLKEAKDRRYINISCEVIDYKPKTLEELLPGYTKQRKDEKNSNR